MISIYKNLIAMVAVFIILICTVVMLKNSESQGEENDYCFKTELDKPPQNKKFIISGHKTICDFLGGNSSIHVYVYGVNEKKDKENLVFIYSDTGDESLPTFEWSSDTDLIIRVKHASQVTKMQKSVDALKIHYEIEKIDYPNSNS